MQVMPREEKPDNPRRAQIAEINRLLVEFARANHLDLLDLAPKFLKPDGTLPRSLMPDFCHPNEQGYMIWADALRPLLGRARRMLAREQRRKRSRRRKTNDAAKNSWQTRWTGFQPVKFEAQAGCPCHRDTCLPESLARPKTNDAKAGLPRCVLLPAGCRVGRRRPGREGPLRKFENRAAHAGVDGQDPRACSRKADGRCPQAEGARLLAFHRFQA